jgi:hypothetical protein
LVEVVKPWLVIQWLGGELGLNLNLAGDDCRNDELMEVRIGLHGGERL